MAFPQTPLDVRIDLQVNGIWTDITSDVYTAEKITITRGRADEGARVDPGKCTLTLNNRLGKYSPRNPLSPYYQLIGRNTPIRVSVMTGGPFLDLPTATPDQATTPDTAALDITGDLDLRWEGEADWYAPGAQILIGKWGAAGNRSYHMRLEAEQLVLHTSQDGTVGYRSLFPLPAQLPRRAALRVTVDVDNGSGGATWRAYQAPTLDGPWTQFGSTTTTTPAFTFYVSTAPLSIAPEQLDLVTPVRRAVTGKCYRAEVRSGIDGTVVAAPDFRAQPIGTTSFTDSAGRTWTVGASASITNRQTRFTGEVSSWPSRWDVSGKDIRVPIEAAGILRRLGQGAKALDSSLRRRIPSFAPLAYWPLEEGQNATQAYSPIDGVAPLTLTQVSWAANDSLASSKPLPVLGSSVGTDPITLNGVVPPPSTTLTQWGVQWMYRIDTAPAARRTFLRILATGTVAEWYLQTGADGTNVIGKDSDGTTLFTQGIATGSDLFGQWIKVEFSVTQSGSNIAWHINWQKLDGKFGTFDGTFAGTIGRPKGVASPADGFSSELNGMAIGHISVWPSADTAAFDNAINAWTGETAGARMTRLTSEEGVPFVHGSTSSQEQVGAQGADTLLAMLEEAADVDGGILCERRDTISLAYRERSSLYSQPVALALDYNAPGHVAPPLEPVDDDQKVRNDVTVTRNGGASGRAILDEGALSVQAPPAGVGIYDESVTLNLFNDGQPEPHAYWRMHLGTVDEARYPVVNLDLAAAPSLINQVIALESGDRVQIANPPAWLPPGPIDLLMQGYQEVIGHPVDWDVQLNCTPAGPWTVAQSAITEDFEDATFDVTLTNGGNLPWARTQVHFNSGSWSLGSGAITNNQTSDAIVTVPDGMTALTFAYRTSSEPSGPGFEGDRLLVLVDGVQALRAQGETPWTQATISVAGAKQVTFRYIKDNSSTSGEDGAWIDDLTFTGPGPVWVDTDGSQLAAAATSSATSLTVATTVGPQWVTTAAYPGEFPFDVVCGGEKMAVTAISSVVLDAFGRTSTDTWGNADSGQAWTNTGGVAADYDVLSGYGRHINQAVSTGHHSVITAVQPDFDLYCDIATGALSTGASQFAGVIARYTDANNLYEARVEFTTAATILLTIRKRVAGVETQLGTFTTSFTHVAGTFVRVRFQGFGSALKARIWQPGTVEPVGSWAIEVTDTAITGAGSLGVKSVRNAGNTNANADIRFENFELVNPQTFTVVRSRNGITKAQTSGTDLRLANPAIVAL
ncbi:hypothetical protein [Streptomyces sp. NPDC047079]|uniref:hypothetical protein n=1 Tax=Streptomyces sp. NPDC047079 TaxID=3154607 RepID=UPI0033F46A22